MISKEDIISMALSLGFADGGFTTAEPFDSQREYLASKREEYAWTKGAGIDLDEGTEPRKVFAAARSIIVLVEIYNKYRFSPGMERCFGRCYLDDDRVTRDGLAKRTKAFRQFLRDNGIESKVPFNVPHRLAAARAGLGTFGRNCLFYSRVARGSSWVLPLAFLVDREFAPDPPSMETACPAWCRNACIAACPTRALNGNGQIDPRRCISYLTYYGSGITPMELRQPMGMRVYGCDRCQDVCPRNEAWTSQEFPENRKVKAMEVHFGLAPLLAMNRDEFLARVWPHMFYMPPEDLWRWKMNAARAMGNSGDEGYVPHLVRALAEEQDWRVRAMAAWALGRLGGAEAQGALEKTLGQCEGDLLNEVTAALIAMN